MTGEHFISMQQRPVCLSFSHCVWERERENKKRWHIFVNKLY